MNNVLFDLQYYYIISQTWGENALEVEGGEKLPGTAVTPCRKNGKASQKWREDKATGTIRCKLNDLCMDIQGQIFNSAI